MTEQIGFIGTGTMGFPMAHQFVKAGLRPLIHDISRHSARPLLDEGGQWANSIEELGAACGTVFLSLPGPREVEQVVTGERGLVQSMTPGGVIIDLSTNAVATVKALESLCADKGLGYLDCPVSGGSKRASQGELLVLAGGNSDTLDRARPLLDILGREVLYLGGPGCGTVAKLVNNQLYLAGEILFYEGLSLASKAGLDLDALVRLLNASGAGGIHSQLAQRVLNAEFDDGTFALSLAEKDVSLALRAGDSLEVPMTVTAAAHEIFQRACIEEPGDRNFWAAVRVIERQARTSICKQQETPDE